MVRTIAPVLVLILALGGCARAPARSEDPMDPPSDEERLQQTIKASEKGPTHWSPAVTIPLYPVVLVADTAIKFVDATYRFFVALFGGGDDDTTPVPDRLQRQAEKIPKH